MSRYRKALTGRRGECGYDNAPATVLREHTPQVNSLLPFFLRLFRLRPAPSEPIVVVVVAVSFHLTYSATRPYSHLSASITDFGKTVEPLRILAVSLRCAAFVRTCSIRPLFRPRRHGLSHRIQPQLVSRDRLVPAGRFYCRVFC